MKKFIFMLVILSLTISFTPIHAKVISTKFIDYHGYQLCEKVHLNPHGDTIVLYGLYQNNKEIIAVRYNQYDYSFTLKAILLVRTKKNTSEIRLFDARTTKVAWKEKLYNTTVKGFKDIAQNKATLDIIGPRRAIKEWQNNLFIRHKNLLYFSSSKI